MAALNQALAKLASVLLNPKSQMPTLDQRFTALTFEFQNFYNELTNSHQPWTYNKVEINVSTGTNDYLVPGNVGKILFAYATPAQNLYGPVSLEISDLAEVTSDYYPYSLLDFGISPDFNELFAVSSPNQISFYRNAAGSLYFRLAPFGNGIQSVSLVYSTGDWIDDIDPTASAILSQYHALPIVRAAISLLPGCEWPDGKERDKSLASTLDIQEKRHAKQFLIAKRSFTGDSEVSYREPVGGNW